MLKEESIVVGMRELSLFSGAGGGLLASKLLGWTTMGYVENDDYCQRILAQRIKDGILDEAPIFGDIRAFLSEGYAHQYHGMVDIVSAGFPCQAFSVAGKREGEQSDKNLWPETLSVIRTVRSRFAFLENVPGLLADQYAKRIFGDLAESGFDARWRVLSAAELGAPHIRNRLWIVAMADTCSAGLEGWFRPEPARQAQRQPTDSHKQVKWWAAEPSVGRVANGVANRVDRLKAIGNGQVPAVARATWEILSGSLR